MNYALILSGGSGTRLWPLSRRAKPKHLISLTGGPSLLEQTLERLDGVIPIEQRFLITVPEQAPIVRDRARGKAMGIIIEPIGRNNVLPMALSTRMILDRDPEAIIAFLPADHNIQDSGKFRMAIKAAIKAASRGYIVTLGIPPTRPEPNYGHIHKGELFPQWDDKDFPAFFVKRFHEKPLPDVARTYTESGEWLWNAGIFVYQAWVMMELINQKQPELAKIVSSHAHSLALANPSIENPVIDWSASSAISSEYRNLSLQLQTSIDYALIERAEQIVTIPVEMGWNDLGGFRALAELIPEEDNGNRVAPRQDKFEANVLLPGCSNVTVFPGKRTIACIDCHDLIIIDTPDALLILPRSSSSKVGEIVELIKQRGWNNLL